MTARKQSVAQQGTDYQSSIYCFPIHVERGIGYFHYVGVIAVDSSYGDRKSLL